MPHIALGHQLLAAAESIEDMDRMAIQVLLRRAALRIQNKSSLPDVIVLNRDISQVIDTWAIERGISRDEAVNEALADWAIAMGMIEP